MDEDQISDDGRDHVAEEAHYVIVRPRFCDSAQGIDQPQRRCRNANELSRSLPQRQPQDIVWPDLGAAWGLTRG